MNHVELIGRLTKDPDVKRTQDGKAVARYTLAVDRKFSKSEQKADFISCVCWEKKAEFAEKYLHKGIKIAVSGRIQTGSYKNRDGNTVYTTDVVVEDQEFCERKQDGGQQTAPSQPEDSYAPQEAEEWATIAPGEQLPWD